MSYCRFGPDSDLYVVAMLDGYQCVACRMAEVEYDSWRGDTLEELTNHMLDHRDMGHKVPRDAIHRVAIEMTKSRNAANAEILTILIFKMALPTMVFNHYVQAGRMIRKLETEFGDVLNELADLDWPIEDDDY